MTTPMASTRSGFGRASTAAIALCFLVLATFEISSSTSAGEDGAVAPDFLLHDQHGRPYRLSERQGRVVVLAFGYAHCPDRCGMTLGAWKRAHGRLGARVADVDFTYVTVDPKRDTPELLGERLAVFDAGFIGLSGTESELAEVYRRYGVDPKETPITDPGLKYLVTHPFRTLVIDRSGRIAREVPYLSLTADEDDLVEALESVLAKAEPPMVGSAPS